MYFFKLNSFTLVRDTVGIRQLTAVPAVVQVENMSDIVSRNAAAAVDKDERNGTSGPAESSGLPLMQVSSQDMHGHSASSKSWAAPGK